MSPDAALHAYRRLYREGATEQKRMRVAVPPIVRELRSESPEGEVVKFVQRVAGVDPARPLETESVLIPMMGRRYGRTYTLCVSSQVGCAMGCAFCETAQMGLVRSLEPHEIVAQWFAARWGVGVAPKNIVFMGMGEPLDNIENVIAAIGILTDRNGPHVAMNKITVSTVGRVDGLRRLAEQVHRPGWHRLGLAVSLNASNDAVRSAIMPINRKWKMEELREAVMAFPAYGGAKICFEYVLIPGVNDAPEHAHEIAEFLRPINEPEVRGMINLIPYNPRRDSPWPAPAEEDVERFLGWLTAAGVYARRRRTKGRETMSACGQLGNPAIRRRKFVDLTTGAAPSL